MGLRTPLLITLLLAGAGSVVVVAAAQQSAVPPPEWARSVEVVDDGTVVHVAAREGARRRGTVKRRTRLPLMRRVAGTGCSTGTWVQVGPEAYVCDGALRMSASPPGGTPQPVMRGERLLPHTYAFVGVDGTRAYAHPSDYEADQYVEAFGEGFGLVVAGRRDWEGIPFVQTRRGLWVERDSLRFARGTDFAGVEIRAGEPLDLAWVQRDGARIFAAPRGREVSRAGRRHVVHVAERVSGGRVRLQDGTYMRARDLAIASAAGRPEGVGPTERWIDVDVDQQVMVAWEGDRPVYATLVSTGRRRRTHQTPIGEFRIWVKLAESNMDDLERSDVERNYAIEGVPWVQYFERSNGFHAAFWHDRFGTRTSHGCVNLTPADARWLFGFTGPALPVGWYAVLPTERDPGTLVRVRDGDPAPSEIE